MRVQYVHSLCTAVTSCLTYVPVLSIFDFWLVILIMSVCFLFLFFYCVFFFCFFYFCFFFFQAEDGIRDLVRSRGLGDVYKRQTRKCERRLMWSVSRSPRSLEKRHISRCPIAISGLPRNFCLLYTSDAADERSSVDLGGRRIINKKNTKKKEKQRRDKTKQRTDSRV